MPRQLRPLPSPICTAHKAVEYGDDGLRQEKMVARVQEGEVVRNSFGRRG